MQNNILHRWVIIIGSILLSILFLINDIVFYQSDNAKKNSDTPHKFLFDNKVINLGLDLQGGKEFLLAPKIDKWLKQLFDSQNKDITNERKDLFKALGDFYENHRRNTNITFTLDSLSTYLENTEFKSSISDLFNGKNKEAIYKDLKEAL